MDSPDKVRNKSGMKTLHAAFLCILAVVSISFTKPAHGAIGDYFNPDYYIGKSLAGVLLLAGKAGYGQYEKISDPRLKARLNRAKSLILGYPYYNYRFKNVDLIIIKGVAGEPNAFSLGPVIFVTQSLGKVLDDRSLTAVLAHEIAHSQKGHLLQRIPMPLGSLIFELAQFFNPNRPQSQASLEKLTEMVQKNIETVHYATELQADCLAAFQLDYLKSLGFPNNSYDLVTATNAIYGDDVTQFEDDYDDPGIKRANFIKGQQYKIYGCDIF